MVRTGNDCANEMPAEPIEIVVMHCDITILVDSESLITIVVRLHQFGARMDSFDPTASGSFRGLSRYTSRESLNTVCCPPLLGWAAAPPPP